MGNLALADRYPMSMSPDTEGNPVKAHVIVLGGVLEGQAQRQADMAAAADDDDVGHGAAAASGLRDR